MLLGHGLRAGWMTCWQSPQHRRVKRRGGWRRVAHLVVAAMVWPLKWTWTAFPGSTKPHTVAWAGARCNTMLSPCEDANLNADGRGGGRLETAQVREVAWWHGIYMRGGKRKHTRERFKQLRNRSEYYICITYIGSTHAYNG